MSDEEIEEAIDFFKNKDKEYSFSFDIPKEQMLELKKAFGIEDDDFDFETYSIRIKGLLNLIEKQQKEIEEKDEIIDLIISDLYKAFKKRPATVYKLFGDKFCICENCDDINRELGCEECMKIYYKGNV